MTRIVIVVTGLCVLLSADAKAEGLVNLDSHRIIFVSQEEATQPSPSDVAPPEEEPGGVIQKGGDCCCDSCCPFELFPETCRGIKVGGWFQMGYHTEGANGVGTRGPRAAAFNDYPNTVQLHQAWIYAEKVAETCGCGFDWGFRLDYMYGTDGQDTQAFGNTPGIWDEPWDNGANYGSAIPQLYAEVAYNDLKVKMGHFYTIMGYEVVPAVDNFFYSHSLTMQYEPFTHTGVLAEYALNDRVTLYGGWTSGWDTGFDQNGGDSYLAGFSLDLTDAMSLTYIASAGDFGFGAGGSVSDAYAHSVVLDWDVSCRLNYVLQTDYVDNNLLFATGPVYGVNQYAFYTLNDRWAVGARLEWLKHSAVDEDYGEVTVGANYRPHSNLVIRPEVRVDALNDTNVAGFRDSTVFGVDAIVTY